MRKITLLTLVLVGLNLKTNAQDSPVEYMSKLGENYKQISKDTWDYIKQASRGKNAGKIEKRRVELTNTLRSAERNARQIKSYEGDISLRDAVVNYLHFSYLILNNDFQKIVDLERIAEESYDDMEAYLNAKEVVNFKMDSISDVLNNSEESFAKENKINLVQSETKLSRKLNNAASINKYYNKIYLVYFKSSWYEQEMIKAQTSGKISDIEQFRQALETSSTEGLEELKTIGLFRGDRKLKDACHFMLTFYISEAQKYMPSQVNFFVKSEKVESTVKSFESKNKKSLTQEDVDNYNMVINEYNAEIARFNKTNEFLNKERSKKFNEFNKSIKEFYNQYM